MFSEGVQPTARASPAPHQKRKCRPKLLLSSDVWPRRASARTSVQTCSEARKLSQTRRVYVGLSLTTAATDDASQPLSAPSLFSSIGAADGHGYDNPGPAPISPGLAMGPSSQGRGQGLSLARLQGEEGSETIDSTNVLRLLAM